MILEISPDNFQTSSLTTAERSIGYVKKPLRLLPRIKKFDKASNQWMTTEALKIEDAVTDSDLQQYLPTMEEFTKLEAALDKISKVLIENHWEDIYGVCFRLRVDKEIQKQRVIEGRGYYTEHTFVPDQEKLKMSMNKLTKMDSMDFAQIIVFLAEPERIKNHPSFSSNAHCSTTNPLGSNVKKEYSPEESFTTTVFPDKGTEAFPDTNAEQEKKKPKHIGTGCRRCSMGCEAVENMALFFKL